MLFGNSSESVGSPTSFRWSVASLAVVCFTLGLTMSAQTKSSPRNTKTPELDVKVQQQMESWILQQRGMPEDWTHRHVVFSNPGTETQALQNGRHAKWQRVAQDQRFTMQLLRRRTGAKELADKGIQLRSGHGQRPPRGGGQGGAGISTSSDVVKDWSMGLGSGGTINPNTFPAKWNYDISTASCANDYVIYPTGKTGSASVASLIAYYNLYSGCGGTVPSLNWAYNTGGQIILSPVFNLEGTQVAFVQTVNSVAYLTVLKLPQTAPGTGTLTAAITPSTAASASAYLTCTAPCMYSIALNGGANNTWSSPYLDYVDDTMYVGDATGKLHKFFPVFNGALAEVTTSWPVQLARGKTNDTNQTTGPVYDPVSGRVFVGTFGGYLYSVGSGNMGTTAGMIYGYSAQIDTGWGLRDSVLVDPNASTVYAFVGYNPSGYSGVYQFSVTFGASAAGTSIVATATGSDSTHTGAFGMSGAFDNTYFNSANAASPSGNLYFTSTEPGGGLYSVPINSNVMGTVTKNIAQTCSTGYYGRSAPLTEFYNENLAGAGATGAITISTDPSGTGWGTNKTVTVGGVTYTFVSALSGANQVLKNTSSVATNREQRTAQNLRAAIDGVVSECYNGTTCFGTGTVANPNATATVSTNTVTATSKTLGSTSTISLSTNYATGILVSAGSSGVDGRDQLFMSSFAGYGTGCTAAASNGCVMGINITTPTSLIISGGINFTAVSDSDVSLLWPATGGLVIDNSVSSATLSGASQIYFGTTYNAATSCTTSGTTDAGLCAVQASQVALQ